MTTVPSSPRLLKGAILGIDPFNPMASGVVFQYNPNTLTRTVKPKGATGEAAKGEAYRLSGPPEETIKVDIETDAADQLERGDPAATQLGIYPQLSALEMLVYPETALVLANKALLAERLPSRAHGAFYGVFRR